MEPPKLILPAFKKRVGSEGLGVYKKRLVPKLGLEHLSLMVNSLFHRAALCRRKQKRRGDFGWRLMKRSLIIFLDYIIKKYKISPSSSKMQKKSIMCKWVEAHPLIPGLQLAQLPLQPTTLYSVAAEDSGHGHARPTGRTYQVHNGAQAY